MNRTMCSHFKATALYRKTKEGVHSDLFCKICNNYVGYYTDLIWRDRK